MVAVWHLTLTRIGEPALPDFLFPKETPMSALFILTILVAVPVLLWAVWFLIEFLRYTLSGEYEMDQRLRDICK
jgi:hypothetical protein